MKKEISLNETIVKVEDSKDKMTSVHIETQDADIYVNGVLVWQKFEDPLYAKVPPIFRSFIQEKNDYIGLDADKKITAELHMKDFHTSAYFIFPKNARSFIYARMDGVNSLEELESDYIRNNTSIDDDTANKLVEEFILHWNNIEKAVNDAGWKLAYSHSMNNSCWAWWDVMFKQSHWNQETFIEIWKLFSIFNKRLNEVFSQYKM